MNENKKWEMTFSIDVQKKPNGTFDIYLSHDGSSGSHYDNISNVNLIGRYLADEIEMYDEMIQNEN